MKLKPARQSSELTYPRYGDYPRDRRRVLQLLAAAGAAAATGTLAGCDLFSRPGGVIRGDIAEPVPPMHTGGVAPHPVPPGDDDDSAEDARPEIAVDGGMPQPDPVDPPADTEASTPTPAPTGDGAAPDSIGVGAHPVGSGVAGGMRAPREPKPGATDGGEEAPKK